MQIFVIKKIRESKNITLYKLSKETGISRTYLRDLENNTKFNPTLLMLEKISNALNVKLKDLFYSLDEIENLRQEMYRRIDEFGIGSKEVMEVSQIIDLLVNIKMRKKE
jgi:transcriptional regulator with XRE-family HTH domain